MTTYIGDHKFKTSNIAHINIDKFKADLLMQTSELAKKYKVSPYYAKKLQIALFKKITQEIVLNKPDEISIDEEDYIKELETGKTVIVDHNEYLENPIFGVNEDKPHKESITRQYKGRVGKVSIKIDDGMVIVEFSD